MSIVGAARLVPPFVSVAARVAASLLIMFYFCVACLAVRYLIERAVIMVKDSDCIAWRPACSVLLL
jgi:hypothetical protein